MSEILNNPLYPVAMAGLVALIFAYARSQWVAKADPGTDKMQEIAGHIRDGAMAFMSRQYRVLFVFVVVVSVLLGVTNASNDASHWLVALSFCTGAFCSGLAGYIGMRVATNANVRTAAAARSGIGRALMVAFSGGTVMGMAVVGLGLLGLTVLVLVYSETSIITTNQNLEFGRILNVVAGFSLGASSIALFARVGGGIFTKAADVGADLVGKIEAGIPEDDPRNPATIADNVGDNVGDVAGMGADLFESYVGSIVGAMVLGFAIAAKSNLMIFTGDPGIGMAVADASSGWEIDTTLSILPLMLAAVGIAASLLGTFFVRVKDNGDPQKALHFGTLVAAVIMIVGSYFAIENAFGVQDVGNYLVFRFEQAGDMLPKLTQVPQTLGSDVLVSQAIFYSVIIGLVAGTLIGLVTEYFTSAEYRPVKFIAKQSLTGSATNIIAGSAIGMLSTAIPVILLVITITMTFQLAGVYGVAIAALGMLSTTGIQLAVDAYGPIADNAGGIAQMAKLPPEVRERTDKLDAVGNTTAAIGKGFAIGSAALTALALFAAFMAQIESTGVKTLNVLNPEVMSGLLIGAMLPFVFSALALLAVGRAAGAMIEEVRRQFREIPGLLEGEAQADHRRCIEISTDAALREMVLPGLMAIVVPVLVGFYSLYALGGLLVGVTASGVLMALFQSNAGGAWDNAKKYIESGHHGGKGSDAHTAAVTGDTVGDPYKDTAGPSLNILIKLISVVALVMAPAFVSYHGKAEGHSVRPPGAPSSRASNYTPAQQRAAKVEASKAQLRDTVKAGQKEYGPCGKQNSCSYAFKCVDAKQYLDRLAKTLSKSDLARIGESVGTTQKICVNATGPKPGVLEKKTPPPVEPKEKVDPKDGAVKPVGTDAEKKQDTEKVDEGETGGDTGSTEATKSDKDGEGPTADGAGKDGDAKEAPKDGEKVLTNDGENAPSKDDKAKPDATN